MKYKKTTSFLLAISFLVVFSGFLIAECIIATSVFHKNKICNSYVQLSLREPLNQTNRLFVILNKTTSFSEQDINGYVYEGRFSNTTKKDFYDWQIYIKLPENCTLESYWNAEVKLMGDFLIISSKKGNNSLLQSNGSISFGFIIKSNNAVDIKNLSFEGYLKEKLFYNPLFLTFFVLLILTVLIYGTALIVQQFMIVQIKLLKNQKERDDLLIEQTMKTFVQFIDAKDEYTRGHSGRVANISMAITRKLGYDEKFQKDIYYMGLMHDIGKLAVPDDILNKTTRLSSDEWEVIQLHTTNGARMLKDFSIMPELKDAVLYHHERYDGKGYVNQLKGEAIPLCARIICVADSYDAMNTNRCYRLKFSKERIIQEIERCSGKQFDPKIVPAMVELIRSGEIEKL